MKVYPLEVDSVGTDTYIVMSRGHHDFGEFMKACMVHYHDWNLGDPRHVWVKTTPANGGWNYNIVDKGARGAWPATYCWEYGDNYEKYKGLSHDQ